MVKLLVMLNYICYVIFSILAAGYKIFVVDDLDDSFTYIKI